MVNSKYQQYNTEYISGIMSLRKPQKKSLEILEDVLNEVDIKNALPFETIKKIKIRYPKYSDFERDFLSMTFALATGVGKTRLMGTFITYLYTNYDIKNFLVIAPNTTIYEKLKKDIGDPSNPKYVFKGIGCFSKIPQVIADDDYKERNISLFESDIKIYIFNIGKLDKENVKIKSYNENLGSSFFDKLANTKDLVMIMDESHHYRADAGMRTLNELRPILGLELTATPFVNTSKGQVPFKNVVYEYPLSKAIADGYTRTPYAVTRSNINFYNFGDEQIDRVMIEDGLLCHENIKSKLTQYAQNNNLPIVKPFMMIVCKDVEHAEKIFAMIKSNNFHDGKYKYKTIIIHSNNKASELETYLKSLLDIEKNTNPIEIVIHVNMLKEGWDVNNLYTIVPLRTASSKILREQMVGRGLRLPYGERTGETEIDSVYLTAHDKFSEILEEAQKGDSIFNKDYIIKVEEIEPEEIVPTQLTIPLLNEQRNIEQICSENSIDNNMNTTELIMQAQKQIINAVERLTCKVDENGNVEAISQDDKDAIINDIKNSYSKSEKTDLAETYANNEKPLIAWMNNEIEKTHVEAIKRYIPIPQIKVTEEGTSNYYFEDFDLDITKLNYAPIENELLIQSLTDVSDRKIIDGTHINYDAYNPAKVILDLIIEKPEIDYSRFSKLIQKLILQLCTYLTEKYSDSGMKNIVMMNKNKISDELYRQMMQHFKIEEGFIKEEVLSTRRANLHYSYSGKKHKDFFEHYSSDEDGIISSIIFTGIKRGVFDTAKFDSLTELRLARILERESNYVINWLRPAPNEFNISYRCNGIHKYEPDFIVETEKTIYLVEVKRADWTDMEDVKAKKKRAISYCKIASDWNLANGYKKWIHVFIPDSEINEFSTFEQLSKSFAVEK